MTLIKCFECGKDVSDKALTCPNCGNPLNSKAQQIQIQTNPTRPMLVEPVMVNKKWKKAKLFSWVAIILGLIFMGNSGGSFNSSNPYFWMGFCFVGYGILALIISKIGAWYTDRQSR